MLNKIKNKVNVFKEPLANIHFKEVLKGGIISFGVKIFTLSLGFFTTWFTLWCWNNWSTSAIKLCSEYDHYFYSLRNE